MTLKKSTKPTGKSVKKQHNKPPPTVLGTGDRISWRSGQTTFAGVVQTAVSPGTTNNQIQAMLDADLPGYLVNLGRDTSKEIRVVVSTTHKQVGGGWQAYDKPRIKAITAPTLSKQLLLYRQGKQRKDREPGNVEIVWAVATPANKIKKLTKEEKKKNDPLDFSDFEATGDDDVFIAGLG
jgi:hypothetical protein